MLLSRLLSPAMSLAMDGDASVECLIAMEDANVSRYIHYITSYIHCTCTYMYIYMYIHACMYVYTYMYKYTCTYVCIFYHIAWVDQRLLAECTCIQLTMCVELIGGVYM